MLKGKVYIVTPPKRLTPLNCNPKIIAFNLFIAQLGKRITSHDEKISQIVQHNLNSEQGPGYGIEVNNGIVAVLAPSKIIKSIIKAFLEEASTYFDIFANNNKISRFAWIRHTVTIYSTRAIYRPENSFNKQSKYNNLFW